MASANQETQTQGRLGVFDAVSIIVGIVIGVSIFESLRIFANSNDPWMGLAVWATCGILALIGPCAMPNWPRIIRARKGLLLFHPSIRALVGFLFGWARLAVIFTARISA